MQHKKKLPTSPASLVNPTSGAPSEELLLGSSTDRQTGSATNSSTVAQCRFFQRVIDDNNPNFTQLLSKAPKELRFLIKTLDFESARKLIQDIGNLFSGSEEGEKEKNALLRKLRRRICTNLAKNNLLTNALIALKLGLISSPRLRKIFHFEDTRTRINQHLLLSNESIILLYQKLVTLDEIMSFFNYNLDFMSSYGNGLDLELISNALKLLVSKNGRIALKNKFIHLATLYDFQYVNLELLLTENVMKMVQAGLVSASMVLCNHSPNLKLLLTSKNAIKVLSSKKLTLKDEAIMWHMSSVKLKYFLSDEIIQAWQEGKTSLQRINNMWWLEATYKFLFAVRVTPNTQQTDPQNGSCVPFKP